MPSQGWREVLVEVDLAGSNCGPGWNTVEMKIAAAHEQSDDHIRESVAQHYAVPLEQVGPVTALSSPEVNDAR